MRRTAVKPRTLAVVARDRAIRVGGLTVALLMLAMVAAATASASAFVRVDQVGYATLAPKRAYLVSSAPETGARITLRSSTGSTQTLGAVGASVGRWSARYPYVYALAFDGFGAPGTYSILVNGSQSTISPPFTIAPAASLYAGPLANALAFYRDERDGPNFIPSALRTAPAHLNDRHARTYSTPRTNADGVLLGRLSPLRRWIDVAGGWWDAGDYLKFVETSSYVVDMLEVGVRDFPSEMGAQARASNFTGEARFGLNWLLRMWDDRTRTLYYQVGIGTGTSNGSVLGDHDIWRLPQADDTYGGHSPTYRYIRHRPVLRAGPPWSRVSPNLAGRMAAAFGLCFQIFKRSERGLAARCLRSGEHIFALANTHPRRLLTVSPRSFYPETEWRDDMELGAVELAQAVRSGPLPRRLPHARATYYLRVSARWARAYMHQSDDATDPLNLYDVSGLADYELYRAIAAEPHTHGLAVTRRALLADMRRQLDGAIAQAHSDPFGFGYPWKASDTTSHGGGMSVLASEYASLTGNTAARRWSVQWLDNILGANPWGSSFIIGDGSTFPRCPQHQVANLIGSLDGGAPVLAGAAVEGPTQSATSGLLTNMRRCPVHGGDPVAQFNGAGAVFKDNVQSYSTDEPAVDLTASSPLAFAWQVAAK